MRRPPARVRIDAGRTVPGWALAAAGALAGAGALACAQPNPALWLLAVPLLVLTGSGIAPGAGLALAGLVVACAVAAPSGVAMLGVAAGLPLFLYATRLAKVAGDARVEVAVLVRGARTLGPLVLLGLCLVGLSLALPVVDRGALALLAPGAVAVLVALVVPRGWWPRRS